MNLTKGEAGKIISEGMSYAKLGKHKKAISFFYKVLKGEQYNVDALYSKGLSLAKLGKHKEAISCFEKILEKHDDAVSCLDKVLEKEPQNYEALFYKANELSELERHDEAISVFDKIIKEHPKNGTVIYAKARSMADIGRYDDSLVLLAQAISYYGRTIKNWAIKDTSFNKLKEDPRLKEIEKKD